MTLLSSSHRSIIKVFPFSLTVQGMNKIEYFFNAREKNIFSSGYTGVEKSFQTEFLNFHFWILWSYGWIMGGKLLWLKYIYIYIYSWVHLWERQFRWTDEWVQFSVFLSPAIHEVTPWPYHNQLCPPQFRINSLIKCSLHSLKSFSPQKLSSLTCTNFSCLHGPKVAL